MTVRIQFNTATVIYVGLVSSLLQNVHQEAHLGTSVLQQGDCWAGDT